MAFDITSSPTRNWERLTPSPLILASAFLVLSLAFGWLAWGRMTQASAAASESQTSLAKAAALTKTLAGIVPPHMPADGPRTLANIIDHSLKASGAGSRALGSFDIQSLGPLPNVASTKRAAHVELTDLTLGQIGTVIDAVESSGLPCWIARTTLSASREKSDRWHAALEIQWLEHTVPNS